MAFNNEHSLGRTTELTHAPDRPLSVEELADWLANVAALDAAEVYRFIDPAFMREQYLEEAERAADIVLDDVKRGYYEVGESYQRYLLKKEGVGSFGVIENAEGRRVIHIGEAVLRRASA